MVLAVGCSSGSSLPPPADLATTSRQDLSSTADLQSAPDLLTPTAGDMASCLIPDARAATNACTTCREAHCCAEANNCYSDADCKAYRACVEFCQTGGVAGCLQGCASGHPSGQQLSKTLSQCETDNGCVC